jgi:hypothetical protein
MDLLNRTSARALFVNTIAGEEHLQGAVSIKVPLLCRDGALVADPDADAWPLTGEPIETEFGSLDGETPFLREGVDLIVLANAYPRAAEAQLGVAIRAGDFSHEIGVFGDRRWERRGGELVASEPAAFEKMPLVWDRAYGGKLAVESGEMPCAANPLGRGFYLDESQAEGSALPNLEDPARPIASFRDAPEPRCSAPCGRDLALRILRSAEFDTSGPVPRLVKFKPAYFNNAHPSLVLPHEPRDGAPFEITHVRPGGESLRFAFAARAFHVYVQLQDRPYVFPAHLESIVVFAEQQRVVLGWKCAFRYRMVPLERRVAVLCEGSAPASPPESYRVDWSAFDAQAPRV